MPDGPRCEITKVEAEEVDLSLNLSLGWKPWWDSLRFALDNGTLTSISHTLKIRINCIIVRKCILCAECRYTELHKLSACDGELHSRFREVFQQFDQIFGRNFLQHLCVINISKCKIICH